MYPPTEGRNARVHAPIATRDSGSEITTALPDLLAACLPALTCCSRPAGIGQGDAGHRPARRCAALHDDARVRRRQPAGEDRHADFAALSPSTVRPPGLLRDVAKQVQRNREAFGRREAMPVFGTIASRFNDDGVTALYQAVEKPASRPGPAAARYRPAGADDRHSSNRPLIPREEPLPGRDQRHRAPPESRAQRQASRAGLTAAGQCFALLKGRGRGARHPPHPRPRLRQAQLTPHAQTCWPVAQRCNQAYAADELVVQVRGQTDPHRLVKERLTGSKITKLPAPLRVPDGEMLKRLLLENLPGSFPFTPPAVFAFKREGEDPTRMFAGEGDAVPAPTAASKLVIGQPPKRLSTAFDSVTLYGHDPDPGPTSTAKVGNSGVSIATLDDMKLLLRRFRPLRPDPPPRCP